MWSPLHRANIGCTTPAQAFDWMTPISMSPNTSGWQKQMLGSFRQSKAKSLPQSAMHIMFDEKSQIGSPNQNKVWCVQLRAHAVHAFPIPKHVATIGMMPWKVLAWNLDGSVLRTISSARTHESCRNRWRLGSRALIGSKGWQSNRVCLFAKRTGVAAGRQRI